MNFEEENVYLKKEFLFVTLFVIKFLSWSVETKKTRFLFFVNIAFKNVFVYKLSLVELWLYTWRKAQPLVFLKENV